jgi:3-dehydroquinate synthetase
LNAHKAIPRGIAEVIKHGLLDNPEFMDDFPSELSLHKLIGEFPAGHDGFSGFGIF